MNKIAISLIISISLNVIGGTIIGFMTHNNKQKKNFEFEYNKLKKENLELKLKQYESDTIYLPKLNDAFIRDNSDSIIRTNGFSNSK